MLTYLSIWVHRRPIAIPLIAILSFSTTWLIVTQPRYWFVYALAFISLYSLFNLFRAYASHINTEHLRMITRKTALVLWLMQLVIGGIGIMFYYVSPGFNVPLVLIGLDCLTAVSLLSSTLRSAHITKTLHLKTRIISTEVPTLTVAIPARNESESLYECLHSLINNDYPKLEILVLDDHSTNRRTSEIVRSFAHDGVEFIPGTEFSEEWLAKNWAYQQLLEAANGQLILFCGADVRFDQTSLRFLVSALVSRNKRMLSVMPHSTIPVSFFRSVFKELRYGWELSLPRRKLERPPVLSTCWLTYRDFLIQNGGFRGIGRKVSPEIYFAKLATKKDQYSFFRSPLLTSEKNLPDQKETAIRLRYPQLHRRIEVVAALAFFEIMLVGLSVWYAVNGAIHQSWMVLALSCLAYVLFAFNFSWLYRLIYGKSSLMSFIAWPYVIVADLWLMHLSMYKYELGEVVWKGRSISSSVMFQDAD